MLRTTHTGAGGGGRTWPENKRGLPAEGRGPKPKQGGAGGGVDMCREHRGFAQHLFALPRPAAAREWWSKAAADASGVECRHFVLVFQR